MKKYQVKAGNRIFSDTDNFYDALTVFRKLDRAGLHPAIVDQFGVVKD